MTKLFAIEQMKLGAGRSTFSLNGRSGGADSLLADPAGGFYVGG